ncbi:phosphoethanolamine transferase [Yeosuana sp. MJ-SS3]|uniref:Phosphoethanolamine transferase n=1 Tax=Gilvirhabdus luticola TaxID=3079858 RepID=A0ABU3U4N8_9FLAO|nr:phosphoethanolamine transferase [Yeosuana sp. MJ-SS3]MDU8885368.1 phosphoethanolamine transferase [Yeosuana sp. MJ-SS3]
MLETNVAETKEFLQTYFNNAILILSLITLILIIFQFKIIKGSVEEFAVSKRQKIKLVLSILTILLFLKYTKLIVFNVPYLAVRTPISYYSEMDKFKNYGKDNKTGKFLEVKHFNTSHDKEFYIIVIGESTSRRHFNLDNLYYRKTAPLLNSLKEEIKIFNNVISPHAYTIGSLSKGLTLGNIEDPEGVYQGSIIQLLNQAGFSTYWISNQRPIGISDTHVTKIARGSDTAIFLNTKHTSEQTPYDEVLLKELNKIAQDSTQRKVVFLHMIGAHFFYEKRYPPKFNIYRDNPITKFKRPEVYKTINAYDNVMRYTDSILYEVINVAKKVSAKSFVLYFSDHGQEVYDQIDFFGQTVDQMITKNMYDIPLFLWMNNAYSENKIIADNQDKKYMTDDIFHSIADLCKVTSLEIDTTRSIFNSNFKERKRIIKDSLDYDSLFLNK